MWGDCEDFADAQKCELILISPGVTGHTIATSTVWVRLTKIIWTTMLKQKVCSNVSQCVYDCKKGNMDVPIFPSWCRCGEFVIVGVSNWLSGTGFERGVKTFFFFSSVRLSEEINPEVPTHSSSANKATSMHVWPLKSPAFQQNTSCSCEYLDCKIMTGFWLLDLFMKMKKQSR